MKGILVYPFLVLAFLFLVSCASHRKGAVCSEIRMRLNSMEYSAEQRVFIQEELDSCESAQRALASSEKKEFRGIYEQFAADSSQSRSDSAEVSPVNP